MEFQRKLRNFLTLLDEAQVDVKYFVELVSSKEAEVQVVVKVWKECFFQASRNRKIFFFFALHELLKETFISTHIYVNSFGEVLRECISHFCQRTYNVDLFQPLQSSLRIWEEFKFYTSQFISQLQKTIEERKTELEKMQEGDEALDLEIVQLIEQSKQEGSLSTLCFYFERNEIIEKKENLRLTLQSMQAMNSTERAYQLTGLQGDLTGLRKMMDYQVGTMQEVGELMEELGGKAKYVEEAMERVQRTK